MSFGYLAGTTTLGAPDEIIDWFITFEAWMITLGWTVAAGAGTQDVYFESVSEAGGLTMLFIHVWRGAGGTIDRVYFEVADDIVPTHQTTGDGYVDSGGVQFAYFMSGDMDAIVICFKVGAGYTLMYAGMVEPFALTVPDETYRMIATSNTTLWVTCAILRDFNNLWDQNHNLWDHAFFDDARIDRYDGSFTLCGLYYNVATGIAGQLKHISGLIEEPAINAEDTIDTGRPGATTSWIVVQDGAGDRRAIRTGGILPPGVPDGNFAHVNGAAASFPDLWNIIAAFAVGRGWVDEGSPPIAGLTSTRQLSSVGETGLEDINIVYGVRPAVVDEMNLQAWDDIPGTNRTVVLAGLDATEFPVNYWLSGDADCLMLIIQRAGGYFVMWGGLTIAFPPGLLAPYVGPILSEYSVGILARGSIFGGGRILRDHSGAYGGALGFYNDGVAANSNPNAFDGVTYLVWPYCAFSGVGADFEPVGQCKYYFFSSGGGIANLDTITVGAEVYTIFFDGAGNEIVMRTA